MTIAFVTVDESEEQNRMCASLNLQIIGHNVFRLLIGYADRYETFSSNLCKRAILNSDLLAFFTRTKAQQSIYIIMIEHHITVHQRVYEVQ